MKVALDNVTSQWFYVTMLLRHNAFTSLCANISVTFYSFKDVGSSFLKLLAF